MKLSANSLKDLLIHTAIIISLGAVMILFFFYAYLPDTTNHGETITVPNLKGIHIDNIDEFLTKRELRYEVTPDSSYSTDQSPLTILTQYPKEGSKVKENRKIYLTLNAQNPPLTKMPALIDGSVRNAKIVLESRGLKLGKTILKPDLAFNAVLDQLHDGEHIDEGTNIYKGSVIDVIVGNGYGNRRFPVPDLGGMPFDEAETLLLGSNLLVGLTISIKNDSDTIPSGTVIKQRPVAEEEVRAGEEIDLWVTEVDSTDLKNQFSLDQK